MRRAGLAARRKSPDDWLRLIYAVEDDDAAQTAAALRSRNIDVNAPLNPMTRESLLDLAAAGSQPEVVRLLLEHGAHARAALGGLVDATKLLLSHGAYVHETDAEGLQAADFARNEDVVAALSAH